MLKKRISLSAGEMNAVASVMLLPETAEHGGWTATGAGESNSDARKPSPPENIKFLSISAQMCLKNTTAH
jgi:hypothetical protein